MKEKENIHYLNRKGIQLSTILFEKLSCINNSVDEKMKNKTIKEEKFRTLTDKLKL